MRKLKLFLEKKSVMVSVICSFLIGLILVSLRLAIGVLFLLAPTVWYMMDLSVNEILSWKMLKEVKSKPIQELEKPKPEEPSVLSSLIEEMVIDPLFFDDLDIDL